jgi:alkylation response protein AidB-like acyl-CoA dehydrogenase
MTVQLTSSWSKTALLEKLESKLGDPNNPDNPLSFAYSQKIDENDRFPEEAIRWIDELELARYLVPEELGGSFRSLAEFAEVMRVLARRDLTCAVGFSIRFWAFLVWVGGSDEQKRWLADYLMERRGAINLLYTEKAHGSDLVANDAVARKTADGYEVTAEKWPINSATVADLCFLLATTDPEAPAAAGMSLFMLDKKELDPGRYAHLPKTLTHGLRGGDISGVRFENCPVPAQNLLGKEGGGLELALKGFQITRALCSGFSLGVGDTALRTTMNFAVRRKLYGEPVIELPHAAQVLSDAFLDLVISECVSNSGLRSFHVVPEQFSVWSPVVKFFVPTVIEAMVQDISVVLGARHYMREEHEWGVFQKMLRDGSIVSVFDGSTVVNLHALLLQFRHLTRRPPAPGDQEARLKQIYGLDSPVPPLNGRKLGLVSFYANDAFAGVERSLERLKSRQADSGLDADDIDRIRFFGEQLLEQIAAHHAKFAESDFSHGHHQSAAMFRAAKKYCAMHAAAACLHTWVWNPASGSAFFRRGKWLVPALARIFDKYLNVHDEALIDASRSEVLAELRRLHEENRMFSIFEARLATN